MSVPVAVSLAELRSPLEKSYRNTVYCAGTLEQDASGKLRGHYCGNRWCLVCNRIRIARAINRYLPVIAAWSEPQLVTLTLPNVKAEELAVTIRDMLRDLVAIGRAVRRTDKLTLRALRKIECTCNAERDDYHPHFHIAVEGREAAEAILRRWLELHPDASPVAQDIRRCDANSLKELFKYFTKLLAKRPSPGSPRAIAPPAALDAIFSAMVGRRVYQPMGFKVAATPTQDENAEVGKAGDTTAPTRRGERVLWGWMQELHDWVDLVTGDVLSGYEPTEAYTQLVHSISPGDTAFPRTRCGASAGLWAGVSGVSGV
ncbi:MAG: protein rep [bacterium]